jgi:serine protease
MKHIIIALFLAVFFLTALTGALMASNEARLDTVSDHVRGEVVIDVKDSLPDTELTAMENQYGIHLEYNSPKAEKYHLMVCQVGEAGMSSLITRLRRDSRVESAEPNYVYQALNEPNDPLYRYQWHMKKIKIDKAWKQATGKNVVVAVIDTGVAYEDYKNFHRLQDLEKTQFVSPYNFVSRHDHANDDHAHGSHVAGTIAQTTNNKKGVAGIAFDCKIMPLKVLSGSGMGRVSDIADAIKYAADNGARVINMSLGGRMSSSTMENACRYAYHKGVTIVCAAGNDNSERVSYPAAYKECIAVSAVRDDDQLTFYSNRGKDIDIAAPGGDMRVDQNGDGYMDGVLQNTIKIRNPEEEDYILFQGTSMAAPHVAGVAALIVSLGYNNPSVVEAILKKSARKEGLGDLTRGYGAGILDAEKAVYAAGFLDGLIKLVLGFMLMLLLLYAMKGIPGSPYAIISPFFLTGMLIGSCGLFFLPSLGISGIPFKEILLCGFPQWDLSLLGTAFHGNVLFYSAFFPFIVCFLFFGNRFLRGIAVGFSTGVAAHLSFWLIIRPAEIQFIPGFLFLDRIWLLVNIILCLYLSYMFISLVPDKSDAALPGESSQL